MKPPRKVWVVTRPELAGRVGEFEVVCHTEKEAMSWVKCHTWRAVEYAVVAYVQAPKRKGKR